jgi:prolyl 4-hydroxylase
MNKLLCIIIFSIVLFLIIRFCGISEYGNNKELFEPEKESFSSNDSLVSQSLHFDRVNNVDNFKIEKLYDEPQILLIDNFLTSEECDYIIKIGDPIVKQSEVCGKNGSRPDDSRTSWTAHIGKKFIGKDKKDPILMNVLEKAARFGKREIKHVEPIQLVRYKPGQYFKSHYDYLDTRIPMYKRNVDKNGQREITFFVYLNDVPDDVGGATQFTKLKKIFKAKKGQAIFWHNVKDGKVDPLTLHSGTELKEGTKYGLNIWIRDKEYIG